MTKKLRSSLDAAIMGYVRKFKKAHGVNFESAVNDDLLGVLFFGDYCFNFSDIMFDVDNKLPLKLIFEWQDACVDAHIKGDGKIINLKSYAQGLRYGNL